MSAFDRLPGAYRDLCKRIANALPARKMGGIKGAKAFDLPISSQNRQVRFEADMLLARGKAFPNKETRQQRRWAARKARGEGGDA